MRLIKSPQKSIKRVKNSGKGMSYSLHPGTLNFALLFLFVCYMVFTNSESGLKAKINFRQEINAIESQIQSMQKEMHQDSIILNKIKNDNNYLERYAREQLFMSHPDEIIYRVD